MIKTSKMYQVREFVGVGYSKALGRRLRPRTDTLRLVSLLKKQGREVFAAPVSVNHK